MFGGSRSTEGICIDHTCLEIGSICIRINNLLTLSLKWLLTRTKEHSGRLWRWVDKIREFQYSVKHIPGRSNTVVDALSTIRKVAAKELAPWTLEYLRQQQQDCATLSQLKSALQSKSRKIKGANVEVKASDDELPYLQYLFVKTGYYVTVTETKTLKLWFL